MPAPPLIQDLIQRFDDHSSHYISVEYKEDQLRQEFINPLFELLGWDMANKAGHAPQYRDVIHEDALKIGAETKAPDYAFCIAGQRKFFLEAKKPAVGIKKSAESAYQLRRYAWSATLPVSILTNFAEFAIYDCRKKPSYLDKASHGRVDYFTHRDLLEKWDEFAAIFSKSAILKGSFDKYADSTKGKRGTATVDGAFLAEIEGWRAELAKNLALRNPAIDNRSLNFAVQVIIDRIIFLRMCEDRGIEPYGQLQGYLKQPDIYESLRRLFTHADHKYNSGLFHFDAEPGREDPDQLTQELALDDSVLKDIIGGLYYPECPYEFSALPADILGQVYEQFLGKVIRLTAAHHAKIEDKPEVKKAGGVYYTPSYIVHYIVEQTVGKLLGPIPGENTPKDAAKLRVLDPACGSGSFLLGAFQYLIDWHLNWYVAAGPEKHKKELVALPLGGYRLSNAEKKRILVNNIHGVDIDPQAVEVTKLSLLLKVLEQETNASLSLFAKERALPDLDRNIRCGNSLIGPDYYDQPQASLFANDEEERFRINAFDWRAEFPKIMKAGGFDAVIGNPPYVRQESLKETKNYFESHYESFESTADLYTYFMEKGVKLLRPYGVFSIIVSSSFLRARYAQKLRSMLKKYAAVERIVDFGGIAVFENAKDTYVCIPLLAKGQIQNGVEVVRAKPEGIANLKEHVEASKYYIPEIRLTADAWGLQPNEESVVFTKVMKAGEPLGTYVTGKIYYGIKTGLNEAFEITEQQRADLIRATPAAASLIKPALGGQNVRRYAIKDAKRFLIVIPNGWTRTQLDHSKIGRGDLSERTVLQWLKKQYPPLMAHLEPFGEALRKRQDQGEYWWELRSCDYYPHFESPKIIFPDICKGPRFYLDAKGYYLTNTAYFLGTEDRYLLGVLNSRVFWYAIGNISIPFGTRAGQFRYRLIYQYMEKIPIRVIDFASPADKSRHGRMVRLVDQMLSLNVQLAKAKAPPVRNNLQRQIDSTGREIDSIIYELYGLSEDDIRIIEAATSPASE